MAEAEKVSCQTSTCSIPDSEPTSDLKDPKISGDVDSWCELPQLIELRTKLRTEMNNTETQALTLEQKICENRVSKVEKTLCGACGFVREPRQRKIAELRLMHKDMLKSKPKHLLCTAGIITHFETMILEGFLDCGSTNKATRCRQCRQERNEATMKSYLMSEFLDILKDHLDNCTKTENCSMTEACSNCLCFMQLCLTQQEKFMTEYLGSKKDDTSLDTQNSNVPDKPKVEPVLDQELSNVATKPNDESPLICSQEDNEHSNVVTESDSESWVDTEDSNIAAKREGESSLILDQDVTNDDTETKKVLVSIQSEFSDYKTILTKHLDSFNTIHDQLTKLDENVRKLKTDFSSQNLRQSRCLSTLQTGVDRLKENLNIVLARGGVNNESCDQDQDNFRGGYSRSFGRGPGPRLRGNGERVPETENESLWRGRSRYGLVPRR